VKVFLRRPLCVLIGTLVILTFCQSAKCDESDLEIKVCTETQSFQDGRHFEPIHESIKTFWESTVGTVEGRSLERAGQSLIFKSMIIRRIAVISGRLLVWFSDASNPITVALGYLAIPTVSAKCDVLYSNDPDCLKQHPCIQPLSAFGALASPE
jgi:hypothetical protein